MIRTFRILALLGIAWLAFGQEPEGGAPPAPGARGARGGRRGGGAAGTREFLGLGPAPDAAEAKKGEPLYKQNCSTCHGENARGSQGPNLVRSVVVLHDEKDEEIGPVIKAGRPQGGMPAFPNFRQTQIHSISQYLKMQIELAANRGTYGQTYGDLQKQSNRGSQAGRGLLQGQLHKLPFGHRRSGENRFEIPAGGAIAAAFLWPLSFGPAKVTVTTSSGEKLSWNHSAGKTTSPSRSTMRPATIMYGRRIRSKWRPKIRCRAIGPCCPKYSNADIHNMTAYLVTLK